MSQATNETKVNEVPAIVTKVTVLEHFRKDTVNEFTGIEFKPIEFLKFIGHLIDSKRKSFILEKKNKVSFVIPDTEGKPLTVVIPNETANSDVITRVQKTVTEVTAQIFSGFMLEEATVNVMHMEILASLQSAGIKFSSFTKIGINKGVSTWVQNKRLKVATLAEKTDRLNLRLNCENVVMREELSGKLAIMQAEKEKMLPELKASLAGYLG
jgi:hypothetical protein